MEKTATLTEKQLPHTKKHSHTMELRDDRVIVYIHYYNSYVLLVRGILTQIKGNKKNCPEKIQAGRYM